MEGGKSKSQINLVVFDINRRTKSEEYIYGFRNFLFLVDLLPAINSWKIKTFMKEGCCGTMREP